MTVPYLAIGNNEPCPKCGKINEPERQAHILEWLQTLPVEE